MLALFTPKLLKRFLDILWWVFLVTCIGLFVIWLYHLLFKGDFSALDFMGIPMVFSEITVPALDLGAHVTPTAPEKLYGELGLRFSGSESLSHPLFFTQAILTVVGMGVVLYGIYLSRKFLENIIDQLFFVQANVDLLKWMGHLSFFSWLLHLLHSVVVRIYFFHHRILPPEISFDTSEMWVNTFDSLFFIVLCYTFAGIFQYGMKLKEDQELTV